MNAYRWPSGTVRPGPWLGLSWPPTNPYQSPPGLHSPQKLWNAAKVHDLGAYILGRSDTSTLPARPSRTALPTALWRV